MRTIRIWHKDLIDVLPRQQLLGQWRELCLIAKSISANGTPNHILVNKIMQYPLSHLYAYGLLVAGEMKRRGYRCSFDRFGHYFTYPHDMEPVSRNDLFYGWHTDRYLIQCYHNLEEKFDCGGINMEEWMKVHRYMELIS